MNKAKKDVATVTFGSIAGIATVVLPALWLSAKLHPIGFWQEIAYLAIMAGFICGLIFAGIAVLFLVIGFLSEL
jgi:hypothetical protein